MQVIWMLMVTLGLGFCGSSASRWHRMSRPEPGAADPPPKRQPHGLVGGGCSGQLTQADGIWVHPLPTARYQTLERGERPEQPLGA
jgi:hypothetical protein